MFFFLLFSVASITVLPAFKHIAYAIESLQPTAIQFVQFLNSSTSSHLLLARSLNSNSLFRRIFAIARFFWKQPEMSGEKEMEIIHSWIFILDHFSDEKFSLYRFYVCAFCMEWASEFINTSCFTEYRLVVSSSFSCTAHTYTHHKLKSTLTHSASCTFLQSVNACIWSLT